MANWFMRGVARGIQTEPFPPTVAPAGSTPGLPIGTTFDLSRDALEMQAVCPNDAISAVAAEAEVDRTKCIHCMRCAPPAAEPPMTWVADFAWTAWTPQGSPLPTPFARSIHVRVVDGGDCGACLNEIAHLNNPLYNAHRFGIFVTPTPRHADVLLVVGPVTAQMHDEIRVAYDAMPEPKRVVAVGVCAINGGVFGPSTMCAAGAADVVPVDMIVPGCPPPPLAILSALRAIAGVAQ